MLFLLKVDPQYYLVLLSFGHLAPEYCCFFSAQKVPLLIPVYTMDFSAEKIITWLARTRSSCPLFLFCVVFPRAGVPELCWLASSVHISICNGLPPLQALARKSLVRVEVKQRKRRRNTLTTFETNNFYNYFLGMGKRRAIVRPSK